MYCKPKDMSTASWNGQRKLALKGDNDEQIFLLGSAKPAVSCCLAACWKDGLSGEQEAGKID